MGTTRFIGFIIPFLYILAGCSDSNLASGRITGNVSVNTDGLERRISELAKYVAEGSFPDESIYEQFKNDVSKQSISVRKHVFEQVARTFSEPTLKTNLLPDRLRLLECHVANVRKMVFLFAGLLKDGDDGEVWEYALRAIKIFDTEKHNISSGIVNPTAPPMGLHIPPEEYLARIEQNRFHAVRAIFEGRGFGLYHRTLPIDQQKNWLVRIEEAAGRNVVIYDPKNPDQPRPRMTEIQHLRTGTGPKNAH